MKSIVIAEKPSQAKEYRSAVGDKYGPIFSAIGHLFEIVPPEEFNVEWKKWSPGLLMPERNNFFPYRLKKDAGAKAAYEKIKAAAKNADKIIIATDPDREGEGIGRNIVEALRRDIKWKGVVERMLPNGSTLEVIRSQFAKKEPAEKYNNLYNAFIARSQADHIYNLSLTRSASCLFNGAISIGRVLTPTLGIVCRREEELANFNVQDYYVPWIEVRSQHGHSCQLMLQHDKKIFDKKTAEKFCLNLKGQDFKIAVEVSKKSKAPPELFSLAKLQYSASVAYKWDIEKTTDVLQRLYEVHQLVTYPRSSEPTLFEAEIENAPAMLRGLTELPFANKLSWKNQEPTIRIKRGAFSDKALEGAPHFAIVPEKSSIKEWGQKWNNLNDDEKKLFKMISCRYLEAIGPDRLYESTKLSVKIGSAVFGVSGIRDIKLGWKEVSNFSDVNDEDESALPPFQNGETIVVGEVGISNKKTTPPSRFTSASLVLSLLAVWELVDDNEIKAILKKTDGLGTEATRKTIISNLLNRKFIEPVSKKSPGGPIKATETGMHLYKLLKTYCPNLLDVAVTGNMEIVLDSVAKGKTNSQNALLEVVSVAEKALIGMREASKNSAAIKGVNRPPSEKQISFAKSIAKNKGISLPNDILSDFTLLKNWISKNQDHDKSGGNGAKEKQSNISNVRPPSEKQISFARSIAEKKSLKLPKFVLEDSLKMSKWINDNK